MDIAEGDNVFLCKQKGGKFFIKNIIIPLNDKSKGLIIMKKTLLGILTLILTLSLFSCDSYNAKKVKLIGNKNNTFYEILDNYAKVRVNDLFDEDADKATYKITVSKNWAGSDKDEINEEALNKDEAAVTYTIIFDSKNKKRVTEKYFTLIYKESNTLVVKGLTIDGANSEMDEYYGSLLEGRLSRIIKKAKKNMSAN